MTRTPPYLRQLQVLDDAIARHPDAAINYVLRGEFWLKHSQHAEAIADFTKAIALAQAELDASDWEYREQAVLDRAQRGLRMAHG